MGTKIERTTGENYDTAVMLRLLCSKHDGNVKIMDNTTIGELHAVLNDYIKLRLEKGISNYE